MFLEEDGPFEASYIRSFDKFSRWIEQPILELRDLGDFIASILREGDAISPVCPPEKPTLSKSVLSNPYSHLERTLNPVKEASGSRRPVNLKSASTPPASSPYLNTILNREPAMQRSTGGHVKMDNTTSQRAAGSNAYEDLVEAAGYGPGSSKESSTPKREPEHKSSIQHQSRGPLSYLPPLSPPPSFESLLEPISASSMREPCPNYTSSLVLLRSNLYNFEPDPAPPGTPQWKIDLEERKGHPIHMLHVGPAELQILAQCLPLVHAATSKGEECMRTIVRLRELTTEVEKDYKQWDEFCDDMEGNLSVDEKEAKEKKMHRNEAVTDATVHGRNDDDNNNNKGKDRTIYAPSATPSRDHNNDADTVSPLPRGHGAALPPSPVITYADYNYDDDTEDDDQPQQQHHQSQTRRRAPPSRDFPTGSSSSRPGRAGGAKAGARGKEGGPPPPRRPDSRMSVSVLSSRPSSDDAVAGSEKQSGEGEGGEGGGDADMWDVEEEASIDGKKDEERMDGEEPDEGMEDAQDGEEQGDEEGEEGMDEDVNSTDADEEEEENDDDDDDDDDGPRFVEGMIGMSRGGKFIGLYGERY